MADESLQQWLGRNRPPRVQITYDLEKGGAIEKVELPLVVGILADLGDPDRDEPMAEFKTRKFVDVDQDTFTEVMAKIGPKLKVDKVAAKIEFKSLDDFTPDRLVESVKELNDKYVLRQHLMNVLACVDSNQELSTKLWELTEKLTQKQLPPPPPPPPPAQ